MQTYMRINVCLCMSGKKVRRDREGSGTFRRSERLGEKELEGTEGIRGWERWRVIKREIKI